MRWATVLGLLPLVPLCSCSQAPFGVQDASRETPAAASDNAVINKRRPLTGRFMHITDFHPDPHYKPGSTYDSGCHRKDKKKKKGKGEKFAEDEETAGKWGSAISDCDSPMSLVNNTFEWLQKEWADEIDFVVWTGDNARHDIDREIPRTPNEIFELNRMMAGRMRETFGKDVVVVPSIGNNDIYPHNVLAAGPSRITTEFADIWKHFIPSDEEHLFERGAYFSSEVIPDYLAVISLNTLYWYDSNTLVDGCQDGSNDPGALEMDWLEVQLQEFRDRGMQVWLTGHVPPHMGVYFDNCYLRYGDLALRYQDTIVGHLYGHMNLDHFFFIDVDELESTLQLRAMNGTGRPELSAGRSIMEHAPIRTQGRARGLSLQAELHRDFKEMPGRGLMKMKDYVAINVSPSIIPTFLPAVRIFSYNISGIDQDREDYEDYRQESQGFSLASAYADLRSALDGWLPGPSQSAIKKKGRKGGHRHDRKKDDCRRPEHEDKPHCTFKHKPRYADRNSPSRRNSMLSPLGYTQFFMPNLDKQTKEPPTWEIEYSTFKLKTLLGDANGTMGPDQQAPPIPLHLLPGYDEFKATKKAPKALRKIVPFGMRDLTIGSYARLARRLADDKKLWKRFKELMFVSSDELL